MQAASAQLNRATNASPDFFAPATLIYLFFFISGMPALAYQLIWQRVLFRIFGVNIESVTIVVTAFMLGLGIGSLIGSWLAARRTIPPLLLIALIEVSIGTFGLCSLRLFDFADYFVQDLSLAAKSLVAVGLVFVPTGLMGMTLPLLVGYLISQSANVGLSTGSLYRVNTLGAVIGCVACALVLFPRLGLQASIWVAAGVNGLVAAAAFGAFLLHARPDNFDSAAPETERTSSASGLLSFPASLGLAFFAGFVSLSYEIFLFRLASFASATSPVVLAMVLAVFLFGISSGAQLAAGWCGDTASRANISIRISRFLLLNSLVGLLILPLLSLGALLGNLLLVVILIAAFLIARALAVIFPLVAHLAVPADKHSGTGIGLIYLANIAGSAAGSMLTGFVLADLFGSRELAILLSLLSFAIAIAFAWTTAQRARALTASVAATVAAATILIVFQRPLSANVMESMLFKSQAAGVSRLSRVVENRDGIIAVSADGTVFGNGIYDGRFNTSLVHDTNGIFRAYGLSLYHALPRDVLMIGLSSGSWAQVIANNPDVAHLTAVEINPGYRQLIRERPEVSSLLKNPKFRIVIDDGRRWLKRHPQERFDAIVANTTFHFRSNASNLLSVEFDNLIRAHLKPGGVYFFNTTDSTRVQRTGCQSFRYGYRVSNNLLVSDAPIELDADHWRKILVGYRIDGRPVLDLARPADADTLHQVLGMTANASVATPGAGKRLMESCASILARTAGAQIVTDDNMGTEWRYPLGLE